MDIIVKLATQADEYGDTLVQFNNTSIIITSCCSIHLVANLVRAVYVCVDPFFSDQIIPIAGQEVLLTITYPLASAASLILSFYWFETISGYNGISVPKFVYKLKVPFIVIIVALTVNEIVVMSIRAARVGNTRLAIQIGGIIYLITCTVLYSFYLVTASILVFKIRKLKSTLTGRAKYQAVNHFLVISSSIGGFVTSVGLIFVQLPLFFTPDGWFATWVLIFTGFLLTSTLQMVMIRTKPKSGTSSSSSKNKKTSSSSNLQTLKSTTP